MILRVNNQPQPEITLDNVSLMIDACKGRQEQRDRAILISLLDTGCRASEFVALNIVSVNLMTGTVTIRHGKGDKSRTTFLGKAAYKPFVPQGRPREKIWLISRKELRRYLKARTGLTATSPVWATNDYERLTRSGLWQILRRRYIDVEIPEP